MKRTRIKGAESKVPEGMLKGSGVAVGITLLGSAIIAWLMTQERMDASAIGYAAMGIILLSSLTGAKIALKQAERKMAFVAAAMGIIYWLILVGGNILLCKGEYEGLWATLFLALGGAISAIFLRFDPKRKKKSFRRKIASR